MNYDYIQAILPSLLRGTAETLKLFSLTLVFSLPLALVAAVAGMSGFSPLKYLTKLYIWVFRGTPLMLQLFFFCYCLPMLITFKLSRFDTAVFAFALNYAAYFAEIYRAGIESVDRGQKEAARSLGFSPLGTMKTIVIPQAVRHIIPPMSNEIITLVKDTSLVFVIGVPELLKAAKDANNRDVNPTAYFAAAVIYLALTALLTVISGRLEKIFSRHRRSEQI